MEKMIGALLHGIAPWPPSDQPRYADVTPTGHIVIGASSYLSLLRPSSAHVGIVFPGYDYPEQEWETAPGSNVNDLMPGIEPSQYWLCV